MTDKRQQDSVPPISPAIIESPTDADQAEEPTGRFRFPFPAEISAQCASAESVFIKKTGEPSEWESRAFAAGWLACTIYTGVGFLEALAEAEKNQQGSAENEAESK